MHLFKSIRLFTLILPVHVLAQLAPRTQASLGILQLVTPTQNADKFAATAIETLSSDARDFYNSYTQIDKFDYNSAIQSAIAQPGQATLAASLGRLVELYIDAPTSLLDDPTALLSRFHASASPWPFSSTMLSQASAILLGYESIVSVDLLKAKNVPTVTPGISINVGGGAVSTGASTAGSKGGSTGGSTGAITAGSPPSTATSKGLGPPAATSNPQLVIAAAAAAAGMLGIMVL